MQVYSRQYLQEFQRCGDLTERWAGSWNVRRNTSNGGDAINIWQKPNKDDPFRLMGLGIEYIKTLIHVLKSSKGCRWSVGNFRCWWSILAIATLALEDEYFKSRSLYPNVDSILESFTEQESYCVYGCSIGRLPGWIAVERNAWK
jgi:citrate synthase